MPYVPPEVPVVSFPSGNPADRVLVEFKSAIIPSYDVLWPGMPHPDLENFPNFVFVKQVSVEGDEKWLRRIWVNERSCQDATNASEDFSGDAKTAPVFVRSYIERRDNYVRRDDLSVLTGTVQIDVTAGGTLYDVAPTISFTGGGGTGAAAFAIIFRGAVVGICLTAEGQDYTSAPTIVITPISAGSGAAATAFIQPATAFLVSEKADRMEGDPLESLYWRVTRTYETLPGPWITTRTKLRGADLFLQLESRRVKATVNPTGGTNITSDVVDGKSANVAVETIKSYVNAAGVVQTPPEYSISKYIPALDVWQTDYHQQQDYAGTPKVIGSQFGTGGLGFSAATTGTAYVIASTREDRDDELPVWVRWTTIPQPPEVFEDETFESDGVAFPAFKWTSWAFTDNYTPQTTLTARTALMGVQVTAGGTGYLSGASGLLALTFGSGAAAGFAQVVLGVVVSAFLTNPGTAYGSAPSVTVSGGSGATLVALLQPTSCVLVHQDRKLAAGALASLFSEVTKEYMTLPGPFVVTKNNLIGGSLYEYEKQRLVAAGTVPAGGSNIISDVVVGKTTTLATNIIAYYANSSGVVQPTPSFLSIRYMPALLTFTYTTRRKVLSPAAPALIDGTDSGTGNVVAGFGVATITLTNAGSGYSTVALITFVGGTQGTVATAVATMKADGTPTAYTAGSAYAINDVLTATEGAFTTPATFTVSTLGLNTAAVNAAGTGVANGMIFTMVGGTHTTAAQIAFATGKLITATVALPGSGYTSGGGTIPLISTSGGVYSVQAVATIVTLQLVGTTLNNGGTNYAPAQTITLSGGTSTTKAVVTIVYVTMTVGIGGGTGSNWNYGDTIQLEGGTPVTDQKASVQVVYLALKSANIDAAGTGYNIGDTVTVYFDPTSDYSGAVLQILTVDGGGGVTSFAITATSGAYGTRDVTSLTTTAIAPAIGTGFTIKDAVFDGPAGPLAFIIGGLYSSITANPTQGVRTGVGTGATFAVTYSISNVAGAFTITTPGNYTVGSTTFTQDSTSGSGSGATFISGSFGLRTVTVTTPGNFTVTSAALFGDPLSTNPGTGASFVASYGLLTGTVVVAGSYTGSLPTSFTVSGGTGVTFNTLVFGIGELALTSTGSLYTQVPPIFTLTLAIKSNGAGYAVGDTVLLSGGTGTPPQVTVLSIFGGDAVGPVQTVAVTTAGSLTALPTTGVFTQASSSDTGQGATFFNGTFKSVTAVSGGSGTGAKVAVLFKIDTVAMVLNGTQYFTNPVVRFSGLGAATTTIAALGTGGNVSGTTYVIGTWTERIENEAWDWLYIVRMGVPPNRTETVSVQFSLPGRTTLPSAGAYQLPLRPGIDYQYESPRSYNFKGTKTYSWQHGAWALQDIPDTFNVITRIIGSRFLPWVRSNTIHPAFDAIEAGSTYAEKFAASTVVGYDSVTGYTVEAMATIAIGNFGLLIVITIPPQ